MNSQIQVVPFEAYHVRAILKDGIIECSIQRDSSNEVLDRLAEEYERDGLSLTGMLEGEPLFIALVKILWPGVADLGALISVRFREHKVEGCRVGLEVIDRLITEYDLHRLHTTVRMDLEQGHRFAQWMGFEREGLARKYTHDAVDAVYYALVR